MALPQTIIYYSINDWIKERIQYNQKSQNGTPFSIPTDLIPPVVGAISRVFSVFAISPLELMRTKLQSKPMSLSHFSDMLKSTVAQDGIRSLWIGIGPTLLRDVPYSAAFWYVYDYNKSRYIGAIPFDFESNSPIAPDFPVAFLFGAMAGFVRLIFLDQFFSPTIPLLNLLPSISRPPGLSHTHSML